MINLKNKTKISTITLILVLTISAILIALPITTAQELILDIPTFLFVTASPNPVGVEQIVYLGAMFSRPTPTCSGYNGDFYEDITVEIVEPDGEKTVFGPYLASPPGGVQFSYTPIKVGEYTIQAHYPGQVLDGTNPDSPTPGGMMQNLWGSTMLPSDSNIVTLVVQEDPVEPIYKTPPLPTQYWTRPIYGTNWDWGELGANWFGLSAGGGFALGGSGQGGDRYDRNFQPAGFAPNAPHIMWTMPTQLGGQPGAPVPADQSSPYSSTSLLRNYFKPVCILNGVLFYNKFSYVDTIMGWRAVDIHTGEILWEKTAAEVENQLIDWGQVFNYVNFQEFGSDAFLYTTVSGGMFRIYDAFTGEYLANVTNTRSTSRIINYDSTGLRGEVLGYYTSGGNLCMYNYTKLLQGTSWRVRVSGNINASTSRYNPVEWETPLPTTFNGESINLGIASVTHDVILMREVPGAFSWQGANSGYSYVAGYDTKTGVKLWGPLNQTWLDYKYEDVSFLCAGDGYYVLHNKDRNQAYGYSLTNGQKLWGPVQLEGGSYSTVYRNGIIGYGKVFISDLGGHVYALDLETGEIVWTYFRGASGTDTPFESYPIFGYNTQSMADGKLFLTEGIMYTPPMHPSYILAINTTDGTEVWKLSQYSCTATNPIADGFLISWNSFDNSIYCIGKGPSATTVSASPKVSVHGSSVLVEGTVMDISGGTKQDVITTRFPNGLPAVSDADMQAWMEYAYQQQIKPEDVEGVEVFLKILDPNGEWYSATVTTDRNGRFSHMWAPAIVGEYQVTAMFEGSESYYPSEETTVFGVDPETTTEYPYVPSAEEIADTTVSKLPAYPDVPTAEEIAADSAQRTINMLPQYPDTTCPEIPAYLTIDLVIIAAVAIAIIIGIVSYLALKKQK